jgi:hypothetical protein
MGGAFAHTRAVVIVAWLPGGKVLSVAPAEKLYRVWDWRSGKQSATVHTGDSYLWWAVASRPPDRQGRAAAPGGRPAEQAALSRRHSNIACNNSAMAPANRSRGTLARECG